MSYIFKRLRTSYDQNSVHHLPLDKQITVTVSPFNGVALIFRAAQLKIPKIKRVLGGFSLTGKENFGKSHSKLQLEAGKRKCFP